VPLVPACEPCRLMCVHYYCVAHWFVYKSPSIPQQFFCFVTIIVDFHVLLLSVPVQSARTPSDTAICGHVSFSDTISGFI